MKSNTAIYTYAGTLFGLCFPVFGTIFLILLDGLEFNWESIIALHRTEPLLWIIDTAPLWLGLFASFAGRKQDAVVNLNHEQENIIVERTKVLCLKNEVLETEIERRKIIETELLYAKEEALKAKEIALDAKEAEERFLANMSHEIRTPLNSIVGFNQLLLETEVTEKQFEYLNSVKYASKHLLAIINDILELSKIKAGQIELEMRPINTYEFFNSVLNTVRLGGQDKGIEVMLDIDEKVPDGFEGDTVRLSQIILNLLNNGIKFTSHGSVSLKVISRGRKNNNELIRLEVKDTGIGIPEDKLDAIFNDFTQAESSTTRIYGGTGLGLSISKKIVELFGGTIGVTSTLGEGSTFWVEMEITPCTPPKPEADDFNKQVKLAHNFKAKVLLVEDNDMNRVLAENIFASWGSGLQVDYAENGKVCIQKVLDNDYDIILMDLQMPEMDGFTACEFIRSSMDTPKRNVPIIALTADVLSTERKRAFNVGMNEYVTKPFKPEELFFKMFKCMKEVPETQSN